MTKVSAQFIHDTMPESHDATCGNCQLLEVEINRLNKLMQGWDKTEAEIKVEAVQEFMHKVINNQFYDKVTLIWCYRNYIKELENDK